MDARDRNPFTPGFGITPAILAGRSEALEGFTAALAGRAPEERGVLISGARGIGKTVLLTEFKDLADDAGWTTVSLHTSSSSIVDELRAAAVGRLRELDPDSTTSWLTGGGASGVTASRQIIDRYDGEAEPLGELLERLTSLRERAHAGTLVMLDELQSVDRDHLHAVTQHFQDLVGNGHEVAFAAAGVRTGVDALLEHERTTFLRRAHRVELSGVDVGTAAEAIRMTVADTDKTITPAAAVRGGEISQGYPYLIQLVGSKAWQNAGDASTIELEDVESARSSTVAAMVKNVHGPALRDLSVRKMDYLMAMLEDDGPSKVGDLARRLGVDARYQSTYRERLIQDELIRPAGRGFVEFSLPYLREAIRDREHGENATPPGRGLTRSRRSQRTKGRP